MFVFRNTRRNDSEGICLFAERQLPREHRLFDLPRQEDGRALARRVISN